MGSRMGRWALATLIGVALSPSTKAADAQGPRQREAQPVCAVRVISPILPLRKSFTACTISASLFITNGP